MEVMDIPFCSTVVFASWWQRFCARTEEVDKVVCKTDLFELKLKPLFYSRENGNHLLDLQLKLLRPRNVVEYANCVCRKGLRFSSIVTRVCCDAPGYINSTHARWANQILNVQRLLQDERVFRALSNVSASKLSLSPKQKSMLWMKIVTSKFALYSGLVMDSCAGTFISG